MESVTLIVLLSVAFLAACLSIFFIFRYFSGDAGDLRQQMRNVSQNQRSKNLMASGSENASLYDAPLGQKTKKSGAHGVLSLQKKLTYAQWSMPPIVFRILEIVISLVIFGLISIHCNIFMRALSLFTGPLVMRLLLNRSIESRFNAFDTDYPQMLMSLVGLLKTGMNPMAAIDTAAEGLDEESLVRQEIELMSNRLRYGVSEDKSIGSFGEEIYHPEIELFVQALLLSRRVGGTLSETLDRLAYQVRKRQYFRKSAKAAISMQRGSIWFILAIMVGLQGYIYIMYPVAITGAIQDETGWQVWQFAIMAIILGIFWVGQVTKIRV